MKAVIDAVFAEGAMLVGVLADVCLFAGVMGPGWGVPRETNTTHISSLSLWKTCDKPTLNGYVTCRGLPAMPGWFTAVQGLVTTCLVGVLLSFSLLVVFSCGCSARFKEDRRLLLVYCVTNAVFSVLGMAGILLFGTRIGKLRLVTSGVEASTASWATSTSFVMTAVGACANLLCVVLVVVELLVGPRRDEKLPDLAAVIEDADDMATSPALTVPMQTVA